MEKASEKPIPKPRLTKPCKTLNKQQQTIINLKLFNDFINKNYTNINFNNQLNSILFNTTSKRFSFDSVPLQTNIFKRNNTEFLLISLKDSLKDQQQKQRFSFMCLPNNSITNNNKNLTINLNQQQQQQEQQNNNNNFNLQKNDQFDSNYCNEISTNFIFIKTNQEKTNFFVEKTLKIILNEKIFLKIIQQKLTPLKNNVQNNLIKLYVCFFI